MSFFIPILSSTRCISRPGILPLRSKFTLQDQSAVSSLLVRFKSRSARPRPSKLAKPAAKPNSIPKPAPKATPNSAPKVIQDYKSDSDTKSEPDSALNSAPKITPLNNQTVGKKAISDVESAKKVLMLLNAMGKLSALRQSKGLVDSNVPDESDTPSKSDALNKLEAVVQSNPALTPKTQPEPRHLAGTLRRLAEKKEPKPIYQPTSKFTPKQMLKDLPTFKHATSKGSPTLDSSIDGAKSSDAKDSDEPVTFMLDAKEEAKIERIRIRREKLLRPGLWTLGALVGVYFTLAFLDVQTGIPSSDGSNLPERMELPQTWYLTPTVILEGAKSVWSEVDTLILGVIAVTAIVHLLKKSPLPIWENMVHVTGGRKWTAFTYPFVNATWTHAATNMAGLVMILPSVTRYFDGDRFHTAAFLISVPLITSYLEHFAYRFKYASGLVFNVGASGSIAAALGVYCVAYAHEKLWLPPTPFRFDVMYCGIIFAVSQVGGLLQTPKGGNRPAYLVHLVSLGIGAAYAYFDLKHHLWIPLVSEISAHS